MNTVFRDLLDYEEIKSLCILNNEYSLLPLGLPCNVLQQHNVRKQPCLHDFGSLLCYGANSNKESYEKDTSPCLYPNKFR